MKDSEQEVKYLVRTIRWTYDDNGEGHFEVEGDERHSQLLLQEWAMQQCKDVDTPVTKAGEGSPSTPVTNSTRTRLGEHVEPSPG